MVYDHKITLKLDKTEFHKIYRKSIDITLYRYHWYWPFKPALKGHCKIDLGPIKATLEYTKQHDIELESKRCVPKLEVSL